MIFKTEDQFTFPKKYIKKYIYIIIKYNMSVFVINICEIVKKTMNTEYGVMSNDVMMLLW